ncbi:MAG: AI-2E family transporter [Verrucomicrobiaceae bacterium]|nr:AI-2E family transporter [Verrucomicrobiaceae bacterium]
MTHFEQDDASQDWGRKGFRMLLALACLVIVFAGMKAAAGFFVPVVFAFFLAVLSFPLIAVLVRLRVPYVLAMSLTMLVIIGVIAGLVTAGVRTLISFQHDFRAVYVPRLQTCVSDVGGWLEGQGIQGAKDTAEHFFDWKTITDYVAQQDVLSSVGSALGSTVGTLASLLGEISVVMILLFFILMEARGTLGRFVAVRLAGGPDMSGLVQSASDVQKYLGIKAFIGALTAVLAFFWCLLFGLKYSLLWALLAFIFIFIPAVGSTIASIPAILEALLSDGVGAAVGVGIGYAVINFFLDNFLQPALLGRRFGVSPLVIILSVVFWGWLWGPIGMFLSVPLTMVAKVMLDNSEEFRWLSVAMSKKKVKHGEVQLSDFDLALVDDEMLGAGASTEPPPRG